MGERMLRTFFVKNSANGLPDPDECRKDLAYLRIICDIPIHSISCTKEDRRGKPDYGHQAH
ncbi:hypothetical protein PACILC2_16710 [Paenibacillus cisolokensis]|uniref:Uncharacterized protein n=1 Tax=Paenibacillus cisolokensis TaxID=1658519 RepID=A0ABQ4N4G5_9BACL|nr:hypothetical protein PACILC2_16710 [Paenibacillus cisolokensis]